MLDILNSSLGLSLRGNTLTQILSAAVAFILLRLFFVIVKKYIFAWGEKVVVQYKKRKGLYAMAQTILHTPRYIFRVLSIYLPLFLLHFDPLAWNIITIVFTAIIFLWAGKVLSKFLSILISKLISDGKVETHETTKNVITLIVNIIVRATAILLFLINVGVQVTPLLASLGIGGIAIAFALQNILQDIFASFSIFLDKPFSVGDFVVIGSNKGSIKHITFKSTHLAALEGQKVIIPNKEVMASTINNYGVMKKRWIKQVIGVVYETALDKLATLPQMVAEEIAKIDTVKFHRAHIKELGAYSIDLEFAYYVESKDYSIYLDKNQEIILALLHRFAHESIQIAYPTQLVYTQHIPEDAAL